MRTRANYHIIQILLPITASDDIIQFDRGKETYIYKLPDVTQSNCGYSDIIRELIFYTQMLWAVGFHSIRHIDVIDMRHLESWFESAYVLLSNFFLLTCH